MVMMVLSRRSSRPALAASSTAWGAAMASASTASGKSRLMSFW